VRHFKHTNMNKLFLTFLLLSIFCVAKAQQTIDESTMRVNIKVHTDSMTNYFLKKDLKSYLTFIYEPMIKLNGGLGKVKADLENELESFAKEGFAISSIKYENISKLIYAKNQIQCTITEKSEYSGTGLKMKLKSTIIAISKDQGKTWKFIDPFGMSLNQLRIYLPELSEEIILPEVEEPIITET